MRTLHQNCSFLFLFFIFNIIIGGVVPLIETTNDNTIPKPHYSHQLHSTHQPQQQNTQTQQQQQRERPQCHALPPSNWINDPNGPIFISSTYHLFFQYNPTAAVWGDMHWGHMSSIDQVHWEWKGIALSPGNISTSSVYDSNGCWTGSAAKNETGGAVIIYTGVVSALNIESQLLAFAADDVISEWIKSDDNPLLPSPPFPRSSLSGFRDPSFWYNEEERKWNMIVGSGFKEKGGMILFYEAERVSGPWLYTNIMIQSLNISTTVNMWECPDLILSLPILQSQYPFPYTYSYPYPTSSYFDLLPTSTNQSRASLLLYGADELQTNFMMIGVFSSSTNRFIADEKYRGEGDGERLDYGNLYAAKTSLDDEGYVILWGWSREDRDIKVYNESGWAGVQIIPRRLYFSPNSDYLLQIPISNLSLLYSGEEYKRDKMKVNNETAVFLEGFKGGSQLDLFFQFTYQSSFSSVFGVRVSASEGLEEETIIRINIGEQRVEVDRSSSSLSPFSNHSTLIAPLCFPFNNNNNNISRIVDLRIIVDHSLLEIFVNYCSVITTRIYPVLDSSQNVGLFCGSSSSPMLENDFYYNDNNNNEEVEVDLRIYHLTSIYNNNNNN